jgi:hypothetical protein
MSDPLDHTEITGTISTPRHAAVRFRAGHECGDLFAEGDEYDGFTLTIEVSGLDDAMAMLEAIRSKLLPSGQEGIWEPDAIYLTEMDWEDADYPIVYASITEHSGGTEYRRADLLPTDAQIAADPRVKALVVKERSEAILAFCQKASISGTQHVLGLPDDVREYRLNAAVEDMQRRKSAALAVFPAQGGE